MAGYLGKISALVTVNTSDIASKIQSGFAAPFEKSLRQIETSLRNMNRSAEKSFDDIYTAGQKAARAIAAAQMGAVKNFNADLFAKQARAAEEIAKPISKIAAEIEKTSGVIRSQFEPALVAVQADAQKLFDNMRKGAAVTAQEIGTVVGKVESLTTAFNAAATAGDRVAAGWKNLNASGKDAADKRRVASMFAAAGQQAMDAKLGADGSRSSMAARAALLDESGRAAAEKRRVSEMFAAAGRQAANVPMSMEERQALLEEQARRSAEQRRVSEMFTAAGRQAAAANAPMSMEARQSLLEEQARKSAEQRRISGMFAAAGRQAAAANAPMSMEARQSLLEEQSRKSAEQRRIADMFAAAGRQAAALNAPMSMEARQSLLEEQSRKSAEQRRIADMFAAAGRQAAEAKAPAPSTLLPSGYLAGVAAKNSADRMRAAFGDMVGSAPRQVEQLKGSIISMQGVVEKLPAPLQLTFIPAVEKLRQRFMNLGTNASQKDIDRLAKGVDGLTQKAERFAQAVKFKGTFAGFLNTSATRTYESQLEAVQTRLSALGATARGPVAASIDKFRQELAMATVTGTAGTEQTRVKMRALVWDITQAAVQAGHLTKAQAKAFMGGIMRAGDVGRFGVEKYSLALQQAAFAVDDFMSATGGMDMKLRAVQNNVSQMAFILGGTTGLFVGLGIAIAGQATLALMKWINHGRTSEDQTKALNDALDKQRNLVDELAKSFDSLADSIAQSALSSEAFSGRQLDKQLDDIRKKQKEAREESLYQLSPGVNAARASKNVAEKAIKAATTEADMLAAQRAMAKATSEEERQKAAVRARAAGGVSSAETMSSLVESFRAQAAEVYAKQVAAAGGGGDETATLADVTQELAIAARLAEDWLKMNAEANKGGDAAALRNRAAELSKAGGNNDLALANLQRTIEILELPVKASADDIAAAVSRASSEAASKIREAQDKVAEAIASGAPGAAVFSVELNKTADALTSAQDKLVSAFKESDPALRSAMVEEARANVGGIVQTIDRQLAASRDFMFGGLGVKGGKGGQLSAIRRVEGAGSILAALEGSEEFGGRGGAAAANLRALLGGEQAARSDLSRAMTFGNGNQRMQAALRLEQVQDQLQRFTDGLPEQIKAAGDAVKAASKQAGKDEKTRAEILERGRDLLISPRQRTIASFRKDLEAATFAAGGPGGAGVAEFVKSKLLEAAPGLAQMEQERAMSLAPPYFQALQASDATSMEGQKELNRLLRGEDASKDKNLDELKTQSELLRDLIAIARQQGVVVDL